MHRSILDTDTLSEVLKQRNSAVLAKAIAYAEQFRALTFSVFTRYEVVRGYKDKQALPQLARFETFCRNSIVLPLTDVIFDRASDLWTIARQGGHPRNDADLLIAATALEHAHVLVTGNVSHFSWMPALQIENWRDD